MEMPEGWNRLMMYSPAWTTELKAEESVLCALNLMKEMSAALDLTIRTFDLEMNNGPIANQIKDALKHFKEWK